MKTVKDNPPSQHLTGNPLAFDRRPCLGAREFEPSPGWGGEFEPKMSSLSSGDLVEEYKVTVVEFAFYEKSWVGGAFEQFCLEEEEGICINRCLKAQIPRGLSAGGHRSFDLIDT